MVRPVQSLYSQGRDTGAADGSLSVTFITRANFQEPSTCRWSTRNTLPWLVDTSLSAVFSLYEKYAHSNAQSPAICKSCISISPQSVFWLPLLASQCLSLA